MAPMLLLIWLLVAGEPPAVSLQNPEPVVEDIYAPLPEAERQDFRAALDSLIALEKAANIYDRFLLNDQRLTKREFLDKRHHLQIVFVPRRISYVPPSQTWVVSGCAVFSPSLPLLGKRSGGVVSDFAARRTTSGWRFDSPPAITIYDDSSSSVRSCTVGG